MAKKKTEDKAPLEEGQKAIEITKAAINDGLCNYSYNVINGTGQGDTVSVKGKGIVDDDLTDAFIKMNAHLACIDGIFQHSGVELTKIKEATNNPLTADYFVSGFQSTGSEDEEFVVLIGHKKIDCTSGMMEIKTPKIPVDKHSSYKFWKDLKATTDLLKEEVLLYSEGKCTMQEQAEKADPNQLKIDGGDDDLDMEKGRK